MRRFNAEIVALNLLGAEAPRLSSVPAGARDQLQIFLIQHP